MSIESKAMFLHNLEQALSILVTADTMRQVLITVADTLTDFDMQSQLKEDDGKDDLLDAYLSALSVQGRSPKTIERYRYLIQRMLSALQVRTRNITVYHLRSYLASEKARGISDRTLDGTRQVFSAYFGWLHREQLVERNPTANLGAIKYQQKTKDVYTDVDVERMKFGCRSLRDRAIVCFLKATGCRISEMVQLNRDSVDFNNLECVVLGKGNKERTVFLDQVAAATLQAYLATRTDAYPALFIGRGTDRIKPGGVRKMLVELGETVHVSHVHPHKFRRTTATNLIRHGMPIQEVAAILGHDKLDTTMQYVVLDKTDIKYSYRKYA